MYFLPVPMVADKDQDPRTRAIRSFHLLRLNLLLHIFPVITLVSIIRLIYYANLLIYQQESFSNRELCHTAVSNLNDNRMQHITSELDFMN